MSKEEKTIERQNMHKRSNYWKAVGRQTGECYNRRMQRRLQVKVKKNRLKQEAKPENTFLRTRRGQEEKKWNLPLPPNRRGSMR